MTAYEQGYIRNRKPNAALAKSSDILIKDNLDKQNAETVDMIR